MGHCAISGLSWASKASPGFMENSGNQESQGRASSWCEKLCVRDSASAGELQPSIWWLRGFLSHRLLSTGMSLSTVPHSGTKPSSVRCSGCGQMDPGGQAVTVQCEDQPTSLQHCINPSSTFMLGLHSCPQCRPLMTTTVSSTPGPFS